MGDARCERRLSSGLAFNPAILAYFTVYNAEKEKEKEKEKEGARRCAAGCGRRTALTKPGYLFIRINSAIY